MLSQTELVEIVRELLEEFEFGYFLTQGFFCSWKKEFRLHGVRIDSERVWASSEINVYNDFNEMEGVYLTIEIDSEGDDCSREQIIDSLTDILIKAEYIPESCYDCDELDCDC